MAYNSDYLAKLGHGPFGIGTWEYHTTDTAATMGAAGYISDAAFSDGTNSYQGKRGLKKGDIIRSFHWSALPANMRTEPYTANATAPKILYTSQWVVRGITIATGVANLEPADVLIGSATYDAASLADGVGATTTVTVTGAALGDFVLGVSHGVDLQGITVTAWVSAADTVSVRFQNESAGTLDLASATLRVMVRPRGF